MLLICAGTACDRSQQREADQRAEQAKAKARELGRKAEDAAKKATSEVDSAVNRGTDSASTSSAQEKLRNGARDLKNAGTDAAGKLSRATLVAKVKTALANDVGLKTVNSIRVTADGQVITLNGTVSSEERKREAEQAAAAVPGVSTVVNHLAVQ
jgi:osmotically-inducible protein OsmY